MNRVHAIKPERDPKQKIWHILCRNAAVARHSERWVGVGWAGRLKRRGGQAGHCCGQSLKQSVGLCLHSCPHLWELRLNKYESIPRRWETRKCSRPWFFILKGWFFTGWGRDILFYCPFFCCCDWQTRWGPDVVRQMHIPNYFHRSKPYGASFMLHLGDVIITLLPTDLYVHAKLHVCESA